MTSTMATGLTANQPRLLTPCPIIRCIQPLARPGASTVSVSHPLILSTSGSLEPSSLEALALTLLCTALGSVIVEVEADDGTVGVGVSIGGDPACFIVENHLSRFVEGQDPR